MSYITACESVLIAFGGATGIPYAFERLNKPIAQLPDEFITYFLVDDNGSTYSENQETSHQPRIQISYFYRDKNKALTIPDQIEAAFMAAFFMRVGGGTIPYQETTRHYGWHCDFRFYERR